MTQRAHDVKAGVVEAAAAFEAALADWIALNRDADELTRNAQRVAKDAGIDTLDKRLGVYRSPRLTAMRSSVMETLAGFHTEGQTIRGPYGVGGINLDA